MGDRDQAGGLDLVGGCKKLVPGLGHTRHTGFFQYGGVGPHPVDAVHIDRGSHVVALVLHDIGHDLGQQAVPLLGLGGGVQIGQHTFGSPFLDGWALDLGCGRWVARHDSALQHGGGVVAPAAGHGKVFPDMAFGLHDLLQLGHGFGFATRSPVVQHLDLAGLHRGRRDHHGHRSGQLGYLEHVVVS